MSYGVQITNGSDFIQVDENYENLLVIASGTLNKVYSTLTVPSTVPDDYLIFCRPNSPDSTKKYRLSANTYKTGSTNYAKMYCAASPYFSAYAVDVDWVICVKAQDLSVPTTNYGLNVFNADSTLSFSSDYPLLRVITSRHHETTASNYATTDTWYTNSSGIANLYSLAMWYSQTSFQVISVMGERFFKRYYFNGYFDYPNNRYQSGAYLVQSDASSSNPVTAQYKLGHKTEILGYAV